jgi:hypothetical protein
MKLIGGGCQLTGSNLTCAARHRRYDTSSTYNYDLLLYWAISCGVSPDFDAL